MVADESLFFTFVESADGFSVGDPVKLMGFNVGEIIEIEAMPADDPSYNVYVAFSILEPYYGYIWSDSKSEFSLPTFSESFLESPKSMANLLTRAMKQASPTSGTSVVATTPSRSHRKCLLDHRRGVRYPSLNY